MLLVLYCGGLLQEVDTKYWVVVIYILEEDWTRRYGSAYGKFEDFVCCRYFDCESCPELTRNPTILNYFMVLVLLL